VSFNILRLVGILFMVGAAVVAVLNLHRVANLGLPWLTFLLMAFGLACVGLSTRLARLRR
jgi:hypothetical protein